MRVLIIGSGIGGACLAHGLRKHHVDVSIFERSAQRATKLPGYGIHINLFGQAALRACLPPDHWRRLTGCAVPIGGKARFYDEKLRCLAELDGRHRQNGRVVPEDRLSISRIELLQILREGLSGSGTNDGVIQWEKTFCRHVVLADGRVRAHFTDGSFEDGDILVGADGSHSQVRECYLPSIKRFDVGVTMIVGRTRLQESLKSQLDDDLINGNPNCVVPGSADWMFVSAWRAPVNPTDIDSEKPEIAPYVVWAYIDATKRFPHGISDMNKPEWRELVLSRIHAWDSQLISLVETCEVESLSVAALRSMPRLPDWRASPVTLLGDAIHNMTPMAGVGANTALRDAHHLSIALTDVAAGRHSVEIAIGDYEQRMRTYANHAINLSLRNARNVLSNSKLKRRVFRGLLRSAEIIPPIGKLLFKPGI